MDKMDSFKVPPHSLQAEQSVLGGLMLDNQAWDNVSGRVGEEDFYRKEHKLIFRAIAELAAKDQPFDVITLSEALSQIGELEDAGGVGYLAPSPRKLPAPPISSPMPTSCGSARCCGS
ncbi:DnaB-like helicase N-terminal domain-containing protein [Methylogaea oryzae]|uniref:DnaB-like helicase N-terminal domain-containing protein n=1 Tax=Methylogaea oryzae TaxID=1295382 RepID=UPI000AD2B61D